LGVLENVEKVGVSSNTKDKAKKESTEKATGKGKHNGTNSNEFQIPKKAKIEKSCMLCQKHGGVHATHNTGECRKYEKDGPLKKGFSKKAVIGQKCHGNGKKDHVNSFVQIMERFSKLKKAVIKTHKISRKKKHYQEGSDSSDSNLE
jgi:hypothetical protein